MIISLPQSFYWSTGGKGQGGLPYLPNSHIPALAFQIHSVLPTQSDEDKAKGQIKAIKMGERDRNKLVLESEGGDQWLTIL